MKDLSTCVRQYKLLWIVDSYVVPGIFHSITHSPYPPCFLRSVIGMVVGLIPWSRDVLLKEDAPLSPFYNALEVGFNLSASSTIVTCTRTLPPYLCQQDETLFT